MSGPFLGGYGDEILAGFALTLSVAAGAMVLAIALGLVGALCRQSRYPLSRGVPELVLIILLYYGIPTIVQGAVRPMVPDYRLDFNQYVTGITVLGMIYGAFATEIFRGAFVAVPPGAVEAARSFGMSGSLVFLRVTLPQAWRFALPGLGNIWLLLIKATALVSVIQLHELMFWSKRAGEALRQPFLFFVVAGVFYLVLTLVSERVLAALEKRFTCHLQPAKPETARKVREWTGSS